MNNPDICGYKWYAPLLLEDNSKRWIQQVCVLPKDHDDYHVSETKVIAEKTT